MTISRALNQVKSDRAKVVRLEEFLWLPAAHSMETCRQAARNLQGLIEADID